MKSMQNAFYQSTSCQKQCQSEGKGTALKAFDEDTRKAVSVNKVPGPGKTHACMCAETAIDGY